MTCFRDMSDIEKGALLLAKHQGKPLQYLSFNSTWADMGWNSSFADGATYRVKPQPVVEEFTYYTKGKYLYGSKEGGGMTHKVILTIVDGVPDGVILEKL